MYDAVVVGAGPNGLAAGVRLAEAGASVVVVEQHDHIGGACRSAEMTLPGFVHDVCSAVHPMGAASPYLRSLPLHEHGLQWLDPEVLLAHPLDDGTAGVLLRGVEDTAVALDDPNWTRLFGPLVRRWDDVLDAVLTPVLRVPRHPLSLARFGVRALWPATALASQALATVASRALFTGIAAHSVNSLHRPLTSAAGLMLGGAGHAAGWPVAAGGSQTIVDALASYLRRRLGRGPTDTRSLHGGRGLPASRPGVHPLHRRGEAHRAGDPTGGPRPPGGRRVWPAPPARRGGAARPGRLPGGVASLA